MLKVTKTQKVFHFGSNLQKKVSNCSHNHSTNNLAIFWSLSNVKTLYDILGKLQLYLRIDFVNPRVSYGRIRGRTALASSMASMATPAAARVKCHLAWDLTTFRPLFHIICQFLFFWHICTFVCIRKNLLSRVRQKNWSSKIPSNWGWLARPRRLTCWTRGDLTSFLQRQRDQRPRPQVHNNSNAPTAHFF